MPVVPQILVQQITLNVANNIKKLCGKSPLEGRASPYFTQLCTAIGMGIGNGTEALSFETDDSGFKGDPPVPGVGTGVGVEVDANYLSEKIYNNIRQSILNKYKQSSHEPWPPSSGNSGEYLRAFSDGIAKAVKDHYKICWVLTSNHPMIYSGDGIIDPAKGKKFKGVAASAVKSLILMNRGMLKGEFLEDFAQGIAAGYQDAIENKTTGKVTITGICIILTPPAGYQLCNIPGTGTGTGAAT